MASDNSGFIGQVAETIEHPFTSDKFPWMTLGLVAGLILIVLFFMHDGLRVIAETVGERV